MLGQQQGSIGATAPPTMLRGNDGPKGTIRMLRTTAKLFAMSARERIISRAHTGASVLRTRERSMATSDWAVGRSLTVGAGEHGLQRSAPRPPQLRDAPTGIGPPVGTRAARRTRPPAPPGHAGSSALKSRASF